MHNSKLQAHMTNQSNDLATKQRDMEIRRSKVRPYVTYLVIIGYLITICYAISWALNNDHVDNALALISNISAVTATIVGFWFGSRRPESLVVADQNPHLSTLQAGEISLENVRNVLQQQGKTLLQLAKSLGIETAEELTVLLKRPKRLTSEQRDLINQATGLV